MNSKAILMSLLLASAWASAPSAHAQGSTPEDAYKVLKDGSLWTHPSAVKLVDRKKVEEAAKSVSPMKLKVLVVPQLGNRWNRGGNENRGGYAKYLNDSQFKLGKEGVVIVVTKKGITGYSSEVTNNRLQQLNNEAAKSMTKTDFTPGITRLALHLSEAARIEGKNAVGAPAKVPAPVAKQSSNISGWICIGIPLIGAGIAGLIYWSAQKKKLNAARGKAAEAKQNAIEAIFYLDSYDGLLEESQDTEAIRQYRTRMQEALDEGTALFGRAKTVDDFLRAQRQFELVQDDLESAKVHVRRATGDTEVAFKIPPRADDSLYERAPLFEPVKGVSYFSSQPSGDLYPVEMNLGGQRRTVMVTAAERDELMAGRMPVMRGMDDEGRFRPWYEVRGYDPYRHYGSGDFLWNALAMGAVMNMMTPHYYTPFGGYGGHWGGYHSHNYDYAGGYGNDLGGDFGGGSFDSGTDFGGSFDSGTDFGGSFDSGADFGGGDFGGSDFGGGDFGGGDFGGGGDW